MHHKNITDLTFVTGNLSKFKEIEEYLKEFAPTIKLHHAALDLPEIQSLDIYHVARHKAAYAWNMLKTPLIIDDGGIFIECYNKFPGTLSKYIVQQIGLEGIWKLAEHDPRVYFMCCIVYQDQADDGHIFEGRCSGNLVKPQGMPRNPDYPYTEIFVPHGSEKTYAQLSQDNQTRLISHRRAGVRQLSEFLNS